MVFESEFLDMMPDEVEVEPFEGFDDYGKPSYGFPTSIRCRIVHRPREFRDKDGRLVLSKAQIWLAGNYDTDVRSRVTLPDVSDEFKNPPLLGVERYPDQDGIHHEVLML